MELDRRLRLEATKSLRGTGNVRNSLQWIRRNPEGFSQRVSEFEATVDKLNELMLERRTDYEKYKNLASVRGHFVEGESISTPSDFAFSYDSWKESGEEERDDTGQLLGSFFSKLNTVIVNRKWEFPHAITNNPNKLASGFLIEGYGLLMEEFYERPGLAREFVLAFEEVLISHAPESALLKDVIDWMAEEKENFSPAITQQIEEELKLPVNELERAAQRINRAFKRGKEAYEVIDDIRRFPRPIAVDFNNVIANNISPLELNPDASAFVKGLREIGNIFIVTSASSWDGVYEFLVEHGLWSSDMVLMTAPTYQFLSSRYQDNPEAKKLRQEYLELVKRQGWNYTEEDLISRLSVYKYVAPLFGKPFRIPIIDDSYYATTDNPGMLGITVQTWEASERMQRIYEKENVGKPTLAEAVEIVRSYYKSIVDLQKS